MKEIRKKERRPDRKKEGERAVFNPLGFSWTSFRREDKRKIERRENDDELVDSGSQLGVLNPTKSPIPLFLPQQLHTSTHYPVQTTKNRQV